MIWRDEYDYWIAIRVQKLAEAQSLYELSALQWEQCGIKLGEVADAFKDCAIALEKVGKWNIK